MQLSSSLANSCVAVWGKQNNNNLNELQIITSQTNNNLLVQAIFSLIHGSFSKQTIKKIGIATYKVTLSY